MFEAAIELSRILKKSGFRNEAHLIRLLLKYAGYEDDWQQMIENLSSGKQYPFDDWFGGKKRIYIPFESSAGESPMDDDVSEVLEEEGYQITDYLGGYCQKDGRTLRIGKVLNKLKRDSLKLYQTREDLEEEQKERMSRADQRSWDDLISTFNNSEYRANKKYMDKLEVVFSQDPHDVAKMSYERNWTSCMELGNGSHHSNVFCEVESGGFVAYLITNDDKNIEKPLARIHIRRFTNENNISFAKPEEEVYGNTVPGFQEFVSSWVADKNRSRYELSGSKEEGVYTLRGGDYSDTHDETEVKPPKTKEGLIEWFNEAPDMKTTRWEFTDNYYSHLEDNGYWEHTNRLDFVREDYYGTREFDTEHEAQAFRMKIDYSDPYDSWIDTYIDESDQEELDERGELDEKMDELREGRFSIARVEYSHADIAKKESARSLIDNHLDEIDEELANSMVEYFLDTRSSPLDLFKLYKTYPSLLTDERFLKARIRDRNGMIKSLDVVAPERADELYQVQKNTIKNDLLIDSDVMKKMIKDSRLSSGSVWNIPTERDKASRLDSSVSDYISAVMEGQIDDELYESIDKFLFNDMFELPLSYRTPAGDSGSFYISILNRALQAASADNMSINAECKFADSLWEYVDLSVWYSDRNDRSKLSVHNWLYFIKKLGERGRVFVPILNKIAMGMENDVDKNEEYVVTLEASRDFGGPDTNNAFSNVLKKFEDRKLQEYKDRMRRIKFVLDCIENNITHSKKYKWFS